MSVVERRAKTLEPAGRDWAEIGLGLVAALALVGIGAAGIWAVVVLVSSLASEGTTGERAGIGLTPNAEGSLRARGRGAKPAARRRDSGD